MSDYEPFEGAKGDPWSTEPVGQPAHDQPQPETDGYYDESQVLARMPDVTDPTAVDPYQQHGHGFLSGRRRRSHSSRPGIPTPVWVVIGLAMVGLAVGGFYFGEQSSNTASQGPDVWTPENPAPDAPMAPPWATAQSDPQWQQPGGWPQDAAIPTTVDAESSAPGIWAATPPTQDWVNAPTAGPYAQEVGGDVSPPVASEYGMTPGPSMAGQLPAQPRPSNWDTSIPPALPTEPTYQAATPPAAPSGYPQSTVPSSRAWTGTTTPPTPVPPAPYDSPAATTPPTGYWNQTPSLATTQPETITPSYGTYPAAQPNPYIQTPSAGSTATANAYPSAWPDASLPPMQGAAPSASANPYALPSYSQPPITPPTDASLARRETDSPYPTTPPAATLPVSPRTPLPSYGQQPAPSATAYPPMVPTAPNPYVPYTTPGAPTGPSYYGAGTTPTTPYPSVARLQGTIQDPAARAASNDSARPVLY